MESITAPETEVLVIERTFAAPPERVFDAFASAEALKQWFGPGECSVLRADIDFTEGGRYRLRMLTETMGEVDVLGVYQKIDRPTGIAFSWKWEGNPEVSPSESTVELEFEAHPDGTLLRLTQTGISEAESRGHHGIGWSGSFDKLDTFLTN
jgi:uncharacterized protein YndB with AHSA1/START domain